MSIFEILEKLTPQKAFTLAVLFGGTYAMATSTDRLCTLVENTMQNGYHVRCDQIGLDFARDPVPAGA